MTEKQRLMLGCKAAHLRLLINKAMGKDVYARKDDAVSKCPLLDETMEEFKQRIRGGNNG